MEDMNKKKDSKSKFDTLVEMWKDKKGRAKIQLALYGIFFLGVIIFTRVLNMYSSNIESSSSINTSFIKEIYDNYEFEIEVNIDDNIYNYAGKILGNNGTITREVSSDKEFYYIMNNKYYILDDKGNYIMTTKDDIFPYIDYRYLDIGNIKQFISIGTKEFDVYKIKLSDLILNNNSEEYITIKVDEEGKRIIIDYTNLFKLDNELLKKEIVTIKYNNINKIISLEE